MTHEKFISDLSSWNSYLPVLWQALQSTSGDVIELGVGEGSTKKLNAYCNRLDRKLFSYESNSEYYHKYKIHDHSVIYVGNNWEIMQERHREPIGVLFSDEAPGEMRKYNIAMFSSLAQVIVAHDSQNDHGYRFSLLKPLFKYHKQFMLHDVGTTAFSNFQDVTKWEL